jgi:hypothetical protein
VCAYRFGLISNSAVPNMPPRKRKKEVSSEPTGSLQNVQKESTTSRMFKSKEQSNTSGRSISTSTTVRSTKDLGDGKTVTVEKLEIDYEHQEQVTRIRMEAEKSFTTELVRCETNTLAKTPSAILSGNSYLKWRLQEILKNCAEYLAWMKTETCQQMQADENVKHVDDTTVAKIDGLGYMALLPWETVVRYLGSVYDADFGTLEEFKNDFISNVFIDKLILGKLHNEKIPIDIWPTCISSIGEISNVEYKAKHHVIVVADTQFSFPLNHSVSQLSGYVFSPPKFFFPLDLLLLMDDTKLKYQEQLQSDRQQICGNLKDSDTFQSYLQHKIDGVI